MTNKLNPVTFNIPLQEEKIRRKAIIATFHIVKGAASALMPSSSLSQTEQAAFDLAVQQINIAIDELIEHVTKEQAA